LAKEWIRAFASNIQHSLQPPTIFLTLQIIAGNLALSRGYKSLEFECRRNFYEAFPPLPLPAIVDDNCIARFRVFAQPCG
jgi:hypothetical protein